MARNNSAALLLDACESGLLDWETLAREFVAYASSDDCDDVAHTLGLEDEDEDEVANDPS